MNDQWTALFSSLTDDIVDNVDNVAGVPRDAVHNVNIVNNVHVSKEAEKRAGNHPSALVAALSTLERRRPDYVDVVDWQHAVEDGRRFIVQWGQQAAALGWSELDLFGLHEPPKHPHPSYRRLSRHDATGLIWLLHGRPVVALTAHTAAIATRGGAKLTFYRRAAS